MDAFIKQLVDFLKTQGGTCSASTLGSNVKRPREVGKIKKVLESRTDLFKLSRSKTRGKAGELVVSLVGKLPRDARNNSLPAVASQLRNGSKTNKEPGPAPQAQKDQLGSNAKVACSGWLATCECYFLIDEPKLLQASLDRDSALSASVEGGTMVSLDCKIFSQGLEVLQVATDEGTYVFDCRALGKARVCEVLGPLLSSKDHIKVIHDLHENASVLDAFGEVTLCGVLDMQLVAEQLWGDMFLRLDEVLEKFEIPLFSLKQKTRARREEDKDMWARRPLQRTFIETAALHVHLLQAAASDIPVHVTQEDFNCLLAASKVRAEKIVVNNSAHTICFNTSDGFAMASAELLKVTQPNNCFAGEKPVVENDVEDILRLLPGYIRAKFEEAGRGIVGHAQRILDPDHGAHALALDRLSEIVLDVGRRPQCWIDNRRVFLCKDMLRLVENRDVDNVARNLGEFGSDNRAGLDGKLHRFSAMRGRDGRIAGITIRIGRSVRGNAAPLMDLLLGRGERSVLILGEPGSGKTTIVREATRILAEDQNVVVVDTSNEIAGDGRVPHSCIGLARRMMVPSLDKQGDVMVECVQNHTPHVMVIDEIGRPREVNAARTVRQRGVRMIASAHGDLRGLLRNKELRGLVGGVESVTMGDAMAKEEAKRKQKIAEADGGTVVAVASSVVSKTKVQREGKPTFDTIVEVRRGAFHEWRVVSDVARAVDDILDGRQYKAELRTCTPETGDMQVKFVYV